MNTPLVAPTTSTTVKPSVPSKIERIPVVQSVLGVLKGSTVSVEGGVVYGSLPVKVTTIVEVLNSKGKVVKKIKVSSGQVNFSTKLKPGMYSLKVKGVYGRHKDKVLWKSQDFPVK